MTSLFFSVVVAQHQRIYLCFDCCNVSFLFAILLQFAPALGSRCGAQLAQLFHTHHMRISPETRANSVALLHLVLMADT